MSDICNPYNCSTIGVLQLKIDGLKEQIDQQGKYAELGRLAMKAIDAYTPTVYDSKPCEGSYNSLGNGEVCGHCNWLVFCQKRAELLTEVVQ